MKLGWHNFIKLWLVGSILWIAYMTYTFIKVMQGFEVAVSDYSAEDILFKVIPAFLGPPLLLAIVLWLAWKMIFVARNKVNK